MSPVLSQFLFEDRACRRRVPCVAVHFAPALRSAAPATVGTYHTS